MVTKRFFKTSWDSLLFQSLIIAALGLDIYACIVSTHNVMVKNSIGENGIGIFAMIVFYLGIPIIIYLETTFIFGPIKLESTRICTNGDKRVFKEKIQYPASVEYTDIKGVTIIPIRKNSNGGSAQLARPIPYLCVETKKGKKVRFGLHFMSTRTVQKLLVGLHERCLKFNNDTDINVEKLINDFSEARWATKE